MLLKFVRAALVSLAAITAVVATPSQAASFSFSNPNCSSFTLTDTGGGTFTLTCIPVGQGNQGPGAPTGCAITRNPSDGNVASTGGAVGASASCSGTVTSWNWRKNGASFATSAAISDTLAANSGTAPVTTTYDVTACNGTSCSNTVVTTFIVAGTGGGGGTAQNFCDQYQNVTYIDVPWGGQVLGTSGGGSFAAKGVLVARFTVPASAAYGNGAVGKIQVAEYGDPATYRQATLSQAACDFRGAPGAYGTPNAKSEPQGNSANFPLGWRFGNTAVAEFTVTGNSRFYPKLVPGQSYYFNIRNIVQDLGNAVSCAGSTCNVLVSINTP